MNIEPLVPTVYEGLEGVVVSRTALSDVDGEAGKLLIAGRSVEELSGQVSFEAARFLIDHGRLPSASEEAAEQATLAAARVRAFAEIGARAAALAVPDAMDALRASIAGLDSAAFGDSASLVGAVAVFAAAHARVSRGLAPLAPDPSRGHAADVLHMALGEGSEPCARALEAYLVTVMDHGLNASTFTARVVASTGSDAVSAISAAIGALKGPLHGGAPGPVLDMLDAIGTPDAAAAWLEAELAGGRRIMGMGHRVYRVRDPRAAVLERALAELERAGGASERLELARAVERAALGALAKKYPARSLAANVEFYTAVLLDAVGIPRTCFSSMFAVGRVAGWCAHVAEQRARGRLIRPASLYDGPR